MTEKKQICKIISAHAKHVVATLLIFLILVSSGCFKDEVKVDKKNLIPEKDLISILFDVQLTTGLLAVPPIYSKYCPLDSISTYTQVIEKHGYNKETFDRTMKYYFLSKSTELNKIYDQVLVRLSDLDAKWAQEWAAIETKESNRWPGKTFYSFPGTQPDDSAKFFLLLNQPGLYTLSYNAIMYPDDETQNPSLRMYTVTADSILTGKKHYITGTRYIKDGIPHYYISTINVENKPILVRGYLYSFSNYAPDMRKHLLIDGVFVTFTPTTVQ